MSEPNERSGPETRYVTTAVAKEMRGRLVDGQKPAMAELEAAHKSVLRIEVTVTIPDRIRMLHSVSGEPLDRWQERHEIVREITAALSLDDLPGLLARNSLGYTINQSLRSE